MSHYPFNIALVGLPGVGKSSLAPLLARKLRFGALDVDTIIEKTKKKKIAELFTSFGEIKFREFEEEAIGSLEGIRNHVIALGAGAVESDKSWTKIKSLARVVYLEAAPEFLAKRLAFFPKELERRPLLSETFTQRGESGLLEKLEALLARREARFESADLFVRVDHMPLGALVSKIEEDLFAKPGSAKEGRIE